MGARVEGLDPPPQDQMSSKEAAIRAAWSKVGKRETGRLLPSGNAGVLVFVGYPQGVGDDQVFSIGWLAIGHQLAGVDPRNLPERARSRAC